MAALLLLGTVLGACREVGPERFDRPVDPMMAGTGGRPGTGGRAAGEGTGGSGPVVPVADAAAAADGAKDMGATIPDVAVVMETGAAPPDAPVVVDLPREVVTVPEVMPEARPPVDLRPDSTDTRPGTQACHPDPMVIAICWQLEPACANCPSAAATTDCYATVEKRDDAACARFAVDRKCLVDTGGNACGSLNCGAGEGPPVAAGCNRETCRAAQGNGDSQACQRLLAACPCR
jgi:hypothetical protein